jgi:Transcriptional Coactivator p15 (PC4)
MQREAPSQIIARVPKNKRESVVVALGAFMGTPLVHVRIHYTDEKGEDRPTAKGICVNVDRLPELRAAVEAAEVEAIRQGLLAGGLVDG